MSSTLIFTLLSRILSSLAASPTQLLMTRMTFLVGFPALPSAGVVVVGASARVVSGVFAAGAAEALRVGLVACCSESGSAGSYWYTTSFLEFAVGSSVGFSVGFSVGLSVGFSVGFSVGSLPSSESSSSSLRVKASSGSGWLSPAAGPAASAVPAASSSCVAAPAAGATAGFAWVPSARAASFRVASFSLVPSLITISSLVSV